MQEQMITVNGNPISQFDFLNAIQSYSMEMFRKTADNLSDEEREQVQEVAVERIIARELIFQQALAEGVVASDDQIKEETVKVMANFPSPEEFYATLEKVGVDKDCYYRMIRQDLSVNMMTEKKALNDSEPDDEEIKAFFEDNQEKMRKPAQVRASHILVKATEEEGAEGAEAQAKINDIHQQVQADEETFADLAQEHSACPSGEKGGDLGFFGPGSMVKEFETVAFALKPGEISDVVKTPFGYHLIKVTDQQEEKSLTFDEVKPQIVSYLKEQAGAKEFHAWVTELKNNAEIDFSTPD
ncbi:MAG: peptidylprolyl isomerase [Thermodesulfobacteriota bacterium]|nr:peptidylprolyl isomerase [Thermodesulfobacteriota bacterium]